jgi:SET domain-containing protein
MFIIKTYIDKSNIAGKGVFAGENIKQGKVVWIFNPKIDMCVAEEKFNLLNKKTQNKILKISSFKNGFYIVPTDNDKYSNHFNNANLIEDINDTNSFSKCLIAARDINIGEELTQNYKTFMSEEEFKIKIPCLAGEIK